MKRVVCVTAMIMALVGVAGAASFPPPAEVSPRPAELVPDRAGTDFRPVDPPPAGQTDRVVIVVIDGVRYSESFGDTAQRNYFHIIHDLAPLGVTYTNFRNEGITRTNPGHASLTTGFYERISNDGRQLLAHPTLLQVWLKVSGAADSEAWIVAAKGKVAILQNTTDSAWHDAYLPSQDCGPDGRGRDGRSRSDSATGQALNEILIRHHPRLVVVNLAEPDLAGHRGDWNGYLAAIRNAEAVKKCRHSRERGNPVL